MSVYKQSIQAFANVINSQIIPHEDLNDLYQTVIEIPEDDEEILVKIDNWLKPESRSKIQAVYSVQLSNLPDINLPDSNVKKLGIGGTTMEPRKESESSKKLLINTIKKNTPEPKPEENSEDKS
ncbi:MAG: hypothetical protein QNJ74_24120 [Trichodesmium sp. MO_231.B1]|nr:hypothetical protein [Trichodesmium sp. MO_231.B1]